MVSKSKLSLSSSDLILGDNKEYAIYVCQTRAIPKIEDGLKTGQRIALWLLSKRDAKIKTFALAGLMGFEKLYVHGEASATNAISLLAAPYKNNNPLIEGHGQFGSRLKPVDGIGAPRYTEVRRSKPAQEFLYKDLDLVPLEDNYDGSNVQPQHFLPIIPTILLNGISGVAIGWSTMILPRKLKGIIQATQDALAGRKIRGLEPFMENYDLSIRNLAPNQWEFSGKATVYDASTVHISELPPGLDIEDFRNRLIAMEEKEQITGYVDSSSDRVNLFVKFKRGSVKTWTDDQCIDFFKLREKITERIVVVDWGGKTISTYPSAEKVVEDFVQWRLGWYTKRFEKKLADTTYELNYWLLLESLFKYNFPKRLGGFTDRKAVETDVLTTIAKAKLSTDDKQLDRVVNLPTYRWTVAYEAEVKKRIAELNLSIKEYEDILGSPDKIKAVFDGELEDLKKIKF